MSLFGSLFSGVTGLSAQSQAMGMISDNVANVNTVAYKGAIAQFHTMVTRSGNVSLFSPGGVRSNPLYGIAEQGLIQASGSPTDVAIEGSGFFVVNTLTDGTGEQLFTRAGNFRSDLFGNLHNAAGYNLMGWALDANENVQNINQLTPVNIRLVSGLAAATTEVEIGANLDASELPTAPGPHFTRDIQVYDSLGSAHTLAVEFTKTAANSWDVDITAAAPNVVTGGSGTVTFNGDGTLAAPAAGLTATIDWDPAIGADQSTITFDLGSADESDGLTQFDSPYGVAFVNQNGAEVGEMNGVLIDQDGFVVARFTNGEQRRLYKLPLATFANPVALEPRNGNVFAQTERSGEFNLRDAGRGGAGRISPTSLEGANVDLADEFTRMIVTQRAYSANARVISTTDTMLDELVRLGR
jgi:flagellar hook protein FlgE